MGGQESKESSDELTFQSPEEKQSLQSSFAEVASDVNWKCPRGNLENRWLATLDNVSVSLLVGHLYENASEEGINFHTYARLYNKFLKSEVAEQVKVINAMICRGSNGSKTQTADLLKYVKSIISSYLKAHGETPKFQSWVPKLSDTSDEHLNRLVEYFAREIIHGNSFPAKDTFSANMPPSRDIAIEEVQNWLNKSSEILMMQTDLFIHIYRPEEESYCHKSFLIPACLSVPGHFQLKSVLDATSLIMLNSAIPPDFRNEWHFLFSSAFYGESFSKILGCITNKGPSIIIIVDTGGNIFGGFASASWELGPKFYGDDSSFLFSIFPKMGVYRPTGYNNHFMYLNVQQQTLPNGLGMGGQFGYFGIWLDAAYGKGHCSKSCTTYDCPPLSSATEFEIRHVEVWAVGKPPKTPQELGERPSVLEGNYEAKALLSMAGKEEQSLGYREKSDLDL